MEFSILSYMYYASLLVISSLLSPEMMSRNAVSPVVIQSSEKKNGVLQGFIVQIVMFHSVIPTVSKNITLWKLSDVHILLNLAKIYRFWKVEKVVIFAQNKPVLKGLNTRSKSRETLFHFYIWNNNSKILLQIVTNYYVHIRPTWVYRLQAAGCVKRGGKVHWIKLIAQAGQLIWCNIYSHGITLL